MQNKLIMIGMMMTFALNPAAIVAQDEMLQEGLEFLSKPVVTELTPARECASQKSKIRRKGKKRFSASLVLEIVQNPSQYQDVTAISSCFNNASAQFQADQTQIFQNLLAGTWASGDEFTSDLKQYKGSWTAEEKVCFVSQYQSMIKEYYTIGDLMFTNVGTDQILETVKNGVGSSGVCVHIHRSGSEIGNALGLQCGTVAAIWETGQNDNSDRGGHGVSVCRTQGAINDYYLVNYGRTFKLDASTYQEAIDATNVFLGPMSLNGIAMTCIDPDMNKFKNCNHIYTAKDSRWGLSVIEEGLKNMAGGESLAVHLSNVEIKASLSQPSHSEIEITNKKGNIKTITLDSGLMIVHDTYQFGEAHFTSLGYGLVRQKESDKSESELKLYFGGYHAMNENRAPGTYSDSEKLSAVGILTYIQGESRTRLTEGTTLRLHGELAAGMTPKIATVMDSGYVGLFKLELDQRLDQNTSIFAAYEGGPTGSLQNNSFTLVDHHVLFGGRFKLGDEDDRFSFEDEFTLHYLGKKSTAIENEGELAVQVTKHFEIEASSHLGQSFSTDPMYGNEFYHRHEVGINLDVKGILIGLEGYKTSGSLPMQYGEGILFDEDPVPGRTLPGTYMGIKIQGRL